MAVFAVLTHQNPVGISADEFRVRFPQGVAYFKSLMARGTVTHAWARVGADGGLTIFDVDSHEELLNALYENPLSPHLDFTVYPLSPITDHFDGGFAMSLTNRKG